MASWRFGVGNLVHRAPAAPVAVSPAAADAVLTLERLADDYPDTLAALQWRGDGIYAIDLDLNLLATSSERADAPTGWADLLLALAGTPGLPASAPSWGTYAGRNALRFYGPVYQDVEVMPGETVELRLGLYLPNASTATGVRVRVVDGSTGRGWEGGSTDDWESEGVIAENDSDDAWLDVVAEIAADPARTERATYRVTIEPIAASYGITTYAYASAPALFAAVDLVALVGHNLPAGATVTLDPQGGGTAIALTPAQPSCYTVATSAQLAQVWRLSIQMPAAIHPRPELGELWVGAAGTLLCGSPVLPIGLEEGSPGQVRVESARGRLEVVPEDSRAIISADLEFAAASEDAAWQLRDSIARLTRYGADPLLILPSTAWGAARCYHGRIGDRISYSRVTPAVGTPVWRFGLPFKESPFA